MATSVSKSGSSLKDYLKKYEGSYGDPVPGEKKKKKKKKIVTDETENMNIKKKIQNKKAGDIGGLRIVDEDPIWQKPVDEEEEEDDEEIAEAQVTEDIEVKRLKRLELLRAKRPYLALSDDGSGWVSVSDQKEDHDKKLGTSVDSSLPWDRKDSPLIVHSSRESCEQSEDTDLSPPRHRRAPLEKDNDLSPPRKSNLSFPRNKDVDSSPSRIQKSILGRDDVDPSPPRKSGSSLQYNDTDLSPSRKHGSPLGHNDADLSLPRKHRSSSYHVNDDLSPPRKKKSSSWHDAAVDFSPPRKRGLLLRQNDANLSPSRNDGSSKLHYDDLDLSPRRKRGSAQLQHDEDDLSPPRRQGSSSLQPDGKGLSPTRKGQSSHHDNIDLSPPRKQKSLSRQSQKLVGAEDVDRSSPKKLAFSVKRSESKDDARRHGLFSKQEIKEEIFKKKREESLRYSELDPTMTGRGAELVYRINGKAVSKEEFLKLHSKDEKPKEKKLEWGQGLAQKREAEARLQELELEKERPFARASDDPELDKLLKERVRWGDPMAHLVKRKDTVLELEDLGNDEKMKESGFVVPQAIPSHSWLKRGVDPGVNRYGIRPGRHWDGVDRSNGFERDMFKRQNDKKATKDEAYLWSVADM
ncbi:uncharacterized protein LOC116267093 [Nymphaea colorata]|nr:uncharacterized protein LOC116267093 [Nymphaea colorata]